MSPNNLFSNIDDSRLKIYGVFNKNENEEKDDIKILKKWLMNQPHLPEITPESHICSFLMYNKFSIEKCKQKIDMYYTIKNLIPDFFDNCNPKSSQMKKVFETADIGLHPKMVEDLYRVFFFKLKKPNALLARETLLTFWNIGEIRLHEDCLFCDIHVMDLANFTFRDMTRVSPTLVMNSFMIYEKVCSFRFKAIYFINAPKYISKLMTILKSLLKPKLFDRIHVCENDEALKNLYSTEYLPKDYGGQGPSLEELTSMIKNKFDEYQNRFDHLDKMRVDENMRRRDLNNDDVLGFHGNFKKLSVD